MNAPQDQPPNPFPKELLASMFSGPEPTEVVTEFIWGARPGHRDDLVRRDRYENGEHVERLYCLMDYFNPVAVIDAAGEVQERYAWSAFGQRTVLDPDWTPRAESALAFDFGFHGQFLDEETEFYNYGYRYYSPELGRWLNRDPIGESGGVNLYEFIRNKVINENDRFGLRIFNSEVEYEMEGRRLWAEKNVEANGGDENACYWVRFWISNWEVIQQNSSCANNIISALRQSDAFRSFDEGGYEEGGGWQATAVAWN